jgi:hypothetical protein
MFLVIIFLDSLIFIYGFQIAFAQLRPQSISPPQLAVVNAITTSSNAAHATASILHVNKQSVFMMVVDQVSVHYPTPEEQGKLDKIVNQTLSMLQPIGRAINESHSCILEAVICGSGNLTNGTMLKI